MQRIAHLVQKLNQQIKDKASPEQLLVTVQMLQKELTGTVKENAVLGTSGISVVIPNPVSARPPEEVMTEPEAESEDKVYFELTVDPTEVSAEEEQELIQLQESIPSYDQHTRAMKARNRQQNHQNQTALDFSEKEDFDALEDIPTLAQHVPSEPKPEEEDYPRHRIRDLKQSIPATDRYAFIRELFRADEDMYERSIKTINNFSIYAEAEYWIRRELRTKLGWLPGHPLVIKFEQLVKNRFA